jgi:hypothetical protein
LLLVLLQLKSVGSVAIGREHCYIFYRWLCGKVVPAFLQLIAIVHLNLELLANTPGFA